MDQPETTSMSDDGQTAPTHHPTSLTHPLDRIGSLSFGCQMGPRGRFDHEETHSQITFQVPSSLVLAPLHRTATTLPFFPFPTLSHITILPTAPPPSSAPHGVPPSLSPTTTSPAQNSSDWLLLSPVSDDLLLHFLVHSYICCLLPPP